MNRTLTIFPLKLEYSLQVTALNVGGLSQRGKRQDRGEAEVENVRMRKAQKAELNMKEVHIQKYIITAGAEQVSGKVL